MGVVECYHSNLFLADKHRPVDRFLNLSHITPDRCMYVLRDNNIVGVNSLEVRWRVHDC